MLRTIFFLAKLLSAKLFLVCLLTACTTTGSNLHSDAEAFSEQRIQSPVFESADECLTWLDEQTGQAGDDAQHFGSHLVLTSWNSQKSSGRRWEEQVHQLIEQSDILLLQEAAIIPAKQEVIPYPFVAVAEAFTSWLGPTGLVSASHVEPLASCTFLNREPLLRSHKASNVLVFPLENRKETLLIINIHSINFSIGLGAYTTQIQRLAEVMEKHDGPIVFGGDLNTWNRRRIDLVDAIAQQLDLEEVEFSTDNRAHFLGRPLDRIYFRGMKLIKARTQPAASSDHDPLIVVWQLRPDT